MDGRGYVLSRGLHPTANEAPTLQIHQQQHDAYSYTTLLTTTEALVPSPEKGLSGATGLRLYLTMIFFFFSGFHI